MFQPLTCISEVSWEGQSQAVSISQIKTPEEFMVLIKSYHEWQTTSRSFGLSPAKNSSSFHSSAERALSTGVLRLEWIVLEKDVADWALAQKKDFYFDFNDGSVSPELIKYQQFNRRVWSLIIERHPK